MKKMIGLQVTWYPSFATSKTSDGLYPPRCIIIYIDGVHIMPFGGMMCLVS